MKSLNTLIRLHRQKMDELRQELVQWQERRARFVQASETLAAQLARELKMAGEYPEMGGFFGQFSKHIGERQDSIRQQIVRADRQIGAIQAHIFQAFGEMKKYEIARDRRLEEERRERELKEQAALDEIGARMQGREGEAS